jgi:hypothetical protein
VIDHRLGVQLPRGENLIAALGEGRYAMTVPQPAAVAVADLTP